MQGRRAGGRGPPVVQRSSLENCTLLFCQAYTVKKKLASFRCGGGRGKAGARGHTRRRRSMRQQNCWMLLLFLRFSFLPCFLFNSPASCRVRELRSTHLGVGGRQRASPCLCSMSSSTTGRGRRCRRARCGCQLQSARTGSGGRGGRVRRGGGMVSSVDGVCRPRSVVQSHHRAP